MRTSKVMRLTTKIQAAAATARSLTPERLKDANVTAPTKATAPKPNAYGKTGS